MRAVVDLAMTTGIPVETWEWEAQRDPRSFATAIELLSKARKGIAAGGARETQQRAVVAGGSAYD